MTMQLITLNVVLFLCSSMFVGLVCWIINIRDCQKTDAHYLNGERERNWELRHRIEKLARENNELKRKLAELE